jgi:RNA polymerase sigma-70 factor (ECF subfamily)
MLTTSVTLLERLRQPQEQAAWARFVDLYTPLFYSWVLRLGLPRQDAADAVQEFFLLLLQRLPQFTYDPQGSFRAWLRTAFRHWARDWLDRQRRLARVAPAEGIDLANLIDPAPGDPLEEAEYRAYLVNRALELIRTEFQPITWRAFHDHMVLGRPPADVARNLGITTNAVYLAKCRVLRRLRQELDGMLE